MRILLVEDEPDLRRMLEAQLCARGFAVDCAADGDEGLFMGRDYPVDLAVIDLGLPKMSGIAVIKHLRAAGRQLPILILTARDNWRDKVEGLEAGADDYLVKPFNLQELLARINALLRRATGWASPVIRCGPLALDSAEQRISLHGDGVELTAYEFKLLEYLMLNAGKVISKLELTEHIYEQDQDRDSNVLEVLIGRLRRKLDPDNSLKPIETLRGRGYRLCLQREKA
ncbi:MAG: response regulator transcription factor [Gammaproteobacteria bacterium]|nr:response regulator transcription factor [Gammaproteobacteria bacterium]MBU1653512.1 response regulator transcription factor [Gammaproteobacteria bacterium]MBU1961860.1 response regulator transcription factor [Gammaproteobacteria bacterium]